MSSQFEHLLARKLVFVSGKGGTGKSTFATLLASYAADNGKKVLLVEQSAKPILPFFIGDNLSGVTYQNLSLEFCFKEFVCKYLKQPFLYEKVFDNDSIQTFLRTIPGLAEAMVLGKLYYTLKSEEPNEFDYIVFDCPASGHFWNLLMTPESIKSSSLGGPFIDYISTIDDFIRSKDVSSVFMTLPEPLVASETAEFLGKLQSENFYIDLLVKNKWIDSGNKVSIEGDYPSLAKFIDKDLKKMNSAEKSLKRFSKVDPSNEIMCLEIMNHAELSLPLDVDRLKTLVEAAK